MAKETKNSSAALNEGNEMDLTKAQVENAVAEPTQGSPNPKSPGDTAASDEETTNAVNGEQLQASTEATEGNSAVPTEGNEATAADTTESDNTVQGDENTSAEQDSQAQATTGPEEKKDGKKAVKKTKATPDFSLNYSDEQKKELERVTTVVGAEIERVRIDPRFHAIAFDDNALINLKGAAMDGVGFKTPEVNRKHGKDEASTGESLMKYGPQHPLIVITDKMAEALGLKVIRFSNDDPTKPVFAGYTLIFLDGNGRMNHLLGLNPKDWPNVYAIFPTKNSAGYYDILKSYEVINTQVTVWKPGDWVTKRILEEGVKAHKGWTSINQLRQKGYNYQAACELMTLGTDRITKDQIISGDAGKIFKRYRQAVKIHNALVKKFGEGNNDMVLKTKAFPAKISELWDDVQLLQGGEKATEYMIAFIDQFPQEQVKKIKEAKGSKKDGVRVTKDAIRIGILETEFNAYMEKHPFNTEK